METSRLLRTTRASLVLRHASSLGIQDDVDGPLARLISAFLVRKPTWSTALDRDTTEATALWAVQWLVGHQVPETNSYWMVGDCKHEYTPMDRAAKRGFVSVVEYLHSHSIAGCTPYAMEHAARRGHAGVVKFLLEHQCEGYPSAAIHYAAVNGHLELVQYLHEKVQEPMTVRMLAGCSNVEVLEYVRTHLSPTTLAQEGRSLVDLISTAVGSHGVDVVKWFHAHIPGERECSQQAIERAIFRKKYAVVKFILQQRYPVDYAAAMDYAAGVGDLEMVKLFHDLSPAGCTNQALDNAAGSCNLDVVRFLSEQRTEGCTAYAMNKAAAQGSLDIVMYLHENRAEGCTTTAIDGASLNGHLAVVEFLTHHRNEGCTTAAIDNAASNGHLDIVQFLFEKRSEGCTTKAMDIAAARGHLALVQYLHEHSPVGCTTGAMDMAAACGHLEVVQFLHVHRQEGCTHLALSNAVFGGYLDVVQFLLESCDYFTAQNRPDISFCQAFLRSIIDGHVQTTEYLYEKYVAILPPEQRGPWMWEAIEMVTMPRHMDVVRFLDSQRQNGETYSPYAIAIASEHGCIEIAEFLLKRGHTGSTVKLMDLAAARGRLDLVQFLHENRSDGCTPSAMDLAARNGHLDVVTFLHEHRSEGCTSRAMDGAAGQGQFAIVQFLHEHRSEGCTDDAMVEAARRGHLNVVRFLAQRRSEGCVHKALSRADRAIASALAALQCPCSLCVNGGAGPLAPWGPYDY